MSTAQLQLLFQLPGDWTQYTLTAVYEDAGGYTRVDTYTQDDIPADQAPALAAVVAALVGLAAPWQASQVWAHLTDVLHFPDDERQPPLVMDGLLLTIEAVNDQGGRKTFTATDYPDFIITDPAAVAFFRHFTLNS